MPDPIEETCGAEETWEQISASMNREEEKFCAAITGVPDSEIYGLVGASGAGGAGNSEKEAWTLSVSFRAWKFADGVLCSGEVRVEKEVSHAELRQWTAEIRPYSILHIRGRAVPHARFTMKMVASEIISVTHRDTELEAIAIDLQKPVTFEDLDFGLFTLDRNVMWFEGNPLWQGREVKLSFDVDESLETNASLTVARTLWRDQDEWARKVNDCAIAELLELKNDCWLDEGEKAVTPDEFRERMKLRSIGVTQDGRFDFWHDDGDLFCGHAIHVWGSLAEGLTNAQIEG